METVSANVFSQIYSRSVSATTTAAWLWLPVNEASLSRKPNANPIHTGSGWLQNLLRSACGSRKYKTVFTRASCGPDRLCPCRRVLHHINYALTCTPARAPEPQDRQEQECWCWCVTLLFGRMERMSPPRYTVLGPGLETTKGKGVRSGRR